MMPSRASPSVGQGGFELLGEDLALQVVQLRIHFFWGVRG